MEFKQFEEIFKTAGFTPRQIKKVQHTSYEDDIILRYDFVIQE